MPNSPTGNCNSAAARERDPPATFGSCLPYHSAKWRVNQGIASGLRHTFKCVLFVFPIALFFLLRSGVGFGIIDVLNLSDA